MIMEIIWTNKRETIQTSDVGQIRGDNPSK